MSAGPVAIHVRDDIANPSAPFRVDGHIRALWASRRLSSHWTSEEHALSFGRFALDKTIHLAIGAAEKLELPKVVNDWTEIAERAEKASRALTKFVSCVAGPEYFSNAPDDSLAWKAKTLRPAFGKMAAVSNEPLEAGMRNASSVAAVEVLLKEYAAFARQKRDEIALSTKNPGDPVLAEFIARLAEAWFLLTGKVPSGNARPESSKFLQFATDAWQDAGGEQPTGSTFGQSALSRTVGRLRAEIDRAAPDQYVPWWANAR